MASVPRVPPASVRRTLRQEVGFGCPVGGCGSPYLTWHHFDPPWHERHHHDPAGMVALCRDHHPEADAGAFTLEQLRAYKQTGRDRAVPLGARFNWMRDQIVAVVGGNFYFECPIAVQIHSTPVIWFGRDEQDNVLVSLRQLTTSREPRMVMLDNFWITEGSAEHDIECPPSGRVVKARYPNGDRLKVEFRSNASREEFEQRYSTVVGSLELRFPLTTVEIEMVVAGSEIALNPRESKIGEATIIGSWMIQCQVGVQIGDPDAVASAPVMKHEDETVRITDLATTGPIVSNQEFVNCVITGPAVVAPFEQTTFSNCSLDGPPDEILWPMPPTQSGRFVGAVGLVNCTFERCRFEGVGFTGPPESLEQMRAILPDPGPRE